MIHCELPRIWQFNDPAVLWLCCGTSTQICLCLQQTGSSDKQVAALTWHVSGLQLALKTQDQA